MVLCPSELCISIFHLFKLALATPASNDEKLSLFMKMGASEIELFVELSIFVNHFSVILDIIKVVFK